MSLSIADGSTPHVSTRSLREYPTDSSLAAARIVALALISNGRIKAVEVAALDALDAPKLLGITRDQWHQVIRDLCIDLVGGTGRRDDAVPGPVLDRLLIEVTDPNVRQVVATLSVAVMHADRLLETSELNLLEAMRLQWGINFRSSEEASGNPDLLLVTKSAAISLRA